MFFSEFFFLFSCLCTGVGFPFTIHDLRILSRPFLLKKTTPFPSCRSYLLSLALDDRERVPESKTATATAQQRSHSHSTHPRCNRTCNKHERNRCLCQRMDCARVGMIDHQRRLHQRGRRLHILRRCRMGLSVDTRPTTWVRLEECHRRFRRCWDLGLDRLLLLFRRSRLRGIWDIRMEDRRRSLLLEVKRIVRGS